MKSPRFLCGFACDARRRRPSATPADAVTWLESNGLAWGESFRSCEQPRHVTAVFARPRNTAIWGKTGHHLVIVARSHHFRTPRVGLPEKVPIAVLLKSSTEQRSVMFLSVPTGSQAKKIDARGFASYQPAAKFGAPSAFFACGEASHSRV